MIDIGKIAEAQGLDEEDVVEFLRDFLEYTEAEDLPGLRGALDSQNVDELRRKAHSIRGAALNLKLDMIAALAEKIEKQADSLPPDEIRQLVASLEKELVSLAEFLGKS